MAQSKQLTQFYQAYSDWLDAGAPAETVGLYKPMFKRDWGLCTNLREYRDVSLTPASTMDEMIKQFEAAGLEPINPFCKNTTEYNDDAVNHIQHLNPKRIAWVKSHLNQGEE